MHSVVQRRFRVIACRSMYREIAFLVSQVKSACDVTFLPLGLHNNPETLRETLRREIAATGPQRFAYEKGSLETGYDYDAILLGYGLCSRGTEGLSSPRYPIVIPRVHDCIAILLGSHRRYEELINQYRGIYWYSPGWIEHSLEPGKERHTLVYETYREKYGEDNARYLMQLEESWQKEYRYALYIRWGFPVDEAYEAFTRECAEFLGWNTGSSRGTRGFFETSLRDGGTRSDLWCLPRGRPWKPAEMRAFFANQSSQSDSNSLSIR